MIFITICECFSEHLVSVMNRAPGHGGDAEGRREHVHQDRPRQTQVQVQIPGVRHVGGE